MSGLSFSLGSLKEPKDKTQAKGRPKRSLLGGDDEDEDGFVPPPKRSQQQQQGKPSTKAQISTAAVPRDLRDKIAAEIEDNDAIYAYDEVYDSMKDSMRKAELAKRDMAASQDGPKYIGKLLESAEQRRKDRLRAEEKKIQHEREKEGDAFDDKESFVTSAYLAQQEELAKEEAEEKKREEKEKTQGAKGMAGFLKSYLDTSAAVHEAAIKGAVKTDGASQETPERSQKTQEALAHEYESQTGKRVVLNDDGEIVDKRQLMSGGLNVVKKDSLSTTKGSGGGLFSVPISDRKKTAGPPPQRHTNERQKTHESRERMSREIERQMLELERKRQAEEEAQKQAEEQKKTQHKPDQSKIEELRRRALERRRNKQQSMQ